MTQITPPLDQAETPTGKVYQQVDFETVVTEITATHANPTPALPALSQVADQVAAADAVIMNSFDAIKAIGRIETAQFYATVAEKIIAETAISLKEGKKYKNLPYLDENGNARHVAHFEEFCKVFLGKSARRTQEIMSNYKMLGGELYEQAEKIGFQQRDYNALKALPEDDQKIIKQAIESDSRDKAIDLMQDMVIKHNKEKQALERKVDDANKQLTAKDSVISLKEQKIDSLNRTVEGLEAQKIERQNQPLPLREELLLKLLDKTVYDMVAVINSQLLSNIAQCRQLFTDNNEDVPAHVELRIAQALGLVITATHTLAKDLYVIPVETIAAASEGTVDDDISAWADAESDDNTIEGEWADE